MVFTSGRKGREGCIRLRERRALVRRESRVYKVWREEGLVTNPTVKSEKRTQSFQDTHGVPIGSDGIETVSVRDCTRTLSVVQLCDRHGARDKGLLRNFGGWSSSYFIECL